LESFTDLALLEDPTETLPKLRLVGLTVAWGAKTIPVPLRLEDEEGLFTSSPTVSVAE
jgi:hypothetical protein